jgi:hypothetical protein
MRFTNFTNQITTFVWIISKHTMSTVGSVAAYSWSFNLHVSLVGLDLNFIADRGRKSDPSPNSEAQTKILSPPAYCVLQRRVQRPYPEPPRQQTAATATARHVDSVPQRPTARADFASAINTEMNPLPFLRNLTSPFHWQGPGRVETAPSLAVQTPLSSVFIDVIFRLSVVYSHDWLSSWCRKRAPRRRPLLDCVS